MLNDLKGKLDKLVAKYNHPSFIEMDPISIPHQFSKKEDIEIMGFWTAMLSWGQRVTIINKASELVSLMDGSPHQFTTQHEDSDLKAFLNFKHRTFNATDTLYFIEFFKQFYKEHESLEEAFLEEGDMKVKLSRFHQRFFALEDSPKRTRKHVSTPDRKSACKRLNMFLRWMVRNDDGGVDFGLWKRISPSELLIPLDVHVFKVAHELNLLKRDKADWLAVTELTETLKSMDPDDPVKYDFALFSLGINSKK